MMNDDEYDDDSDVNEDSLVIKLTIWMVYIGENNYLLHFVGGFVVNYSFIEFSNHVFYNTQC